MILSQKHVNSVLRWTICEVITRGSEAHEKLVDVFGEHTFFKSVEGVFIMEPINADRPSKQNLVKRVRVATWTSDERKLLRPIRWNNAACEIAI
ncbi:MAG: hypothetical protein MRY74_17495 [Neomegalonema sp.]|nr:hypothetical protein [Neomegalonema sp.]